MKKIRICKRCIMDNINTDIEFDSKGICNYCTNALIRESDIWNKNGQDELKSIIEEMKMVNKKKKYDCVIGISGGIDSCYTAYLLSKFNVRMLGVHIDCGWDTEVSKKNINNLCNKLGIELITIKKDYNELFDLQRAYFLAEVPNQDVPQDHVFFAELYRCAIKNGIKYFISGDNFSSECILPKCWGHNSMDGKNLKDIYKKYGTKKLKDVKPLSFFEIYFKIPYIDRLKKIKPLNFINYNKEEAIKELNKELDFNYYGGKHCESSFTRLFQNYILPKKFGINKSKAHLSSLIVSNQITRDEALKKLKKNEYDDNKQLLIDDINLFIKNLGISKELFDEIMSNNNRREHTDFKNTQKLYNFFQIIKGK